ncbi:MAG: hypothetical protein IJI53_09020 [Clostridia bacterium]|nr:hypothetical protein [Clostridia bacterium]MBR0408165.1 hypothetical protein [Clostridia bacterium]
MKYKNTLHIAIFSLLLVLQFVSPGVASADGTGFEDLPAWRALPVYVMERNIEGPADSFVRYPELMTEDSAYQPSVEKINAAIQAQANIPGYLQLLSTISEGSTGLRMDYEIGALCYHSADMPDGQSQLGNSYLSILFSAEGKMLQGRPSQIYYPMTFDLRTGESMTFDQLFTDPDAAKERIEALLETDVEPTLSTYLENNQLFPVPYDRFFLDGFGHLIIVYEQNQLSFLSGYSGSVSFRYSELIPQLNFSSAELEGYFDPVLTASEETRLSFIQQMMRSLPVATRRTISLGDDLEKVLSDFRSTTDSGYYPDGAYYEVEDANYRGTLILTDESEETVTGLLTSRTDLMDIQTGKTTLDEAIALIGAEPAIRLPIDETAAEMYRVCPGALALYTFTDDQGRPVQFFLYADEAGTVQYISLELV